MPQEGEVASHQLGCSILRGNSSGTFFHAPLPVVSRQIQHWLQLPAQSAASSFPPPKWPYLTYRLANNAFKLLGEQELETRWELTLSCGSGLKPPKCWQFLNTSSIIKPLHDCVPVDVGKGLEHTSHPYLPSKSPRGLPNFVSVKTWNNQNILSFC